MQAGKMADAELSSLVESLKAYDCGKGCNLGLYEVAGNLSATMRKLAEKGESALGSLHPLLLDEGEWSCMLALKILQEIKSEKSVPYLVDFIKQVKDETVGWEAVNALVAIGKPAIGPLMKEAKSGFENKRDDAAAALTLIKDDAVYSFMVGVIEDYIANCEKYRGWFNISDFVYDFAAQGKKEVVPLLRRLLEVKQFTRAERVDILDSIKLIESPEEYDREGEKCLEKAGFSMCDAIKRLENKRSGKPAQVVCHGKRVA